MNRVTLISICLLSLLVGLLAACAKPALSPDELVLRERAFGLWSRAGGKLTHAETTVEVPCALGTTFGATIDVSFPRKGRVALPIAAQWQQIPLKGQPVTPERFLPEPFYAPSGTNQFALDAVNTLTERRELRKGTFVLRLFNPANDRDYYARTFELVGCK